MEPESNYGEDMDRIQDWARQVVCNMQKDKTFWEHINAFLEAIDWTEYWLLSLLLFELI